MNINIDLSNIKVMYESIFLVSPEKSDAENKQVVAKFEKMIKEGGGEIINLENWGSKKLAYPIDGHENAWYTFIEFKAPADLVSKLEQEYIYDEGIIRYLTVKLDKFAVAFNKKRREQGFGKKEAVNN